MLVQRHQSSQLVCSAGLLCPCQSSKVLLNKWWRGVVQIFEKEADEYLRYNFSYNLIQLFSMLEYLILNGKFEAAKHFDSNTKNSLRDELLNHFQKGNRIEFMEIFGMLHKESKLEFYLRVYFLIYSIHPALRAKSSIPEPEKVAFRDFLDNKGSELAKTSQFLQFYALPFIKKPLQHLAFKNLFKREWVANLKDKLELFILQQQRMLKTEIAKVFHEPQSAGGSAGEARAWQDKVREMEKINKKLFEEVKEFTEKYHELEDSHKLMMDGYQTHMMQSQSKWFQITKELVECSKSLIEMLITSTSDYVQDRRFLKIKKRTEKYERFVNKKFDDLVSHSEDISIFDRPSISQLSYSITPHSQKVLHTHHQPLNTVDDYIPTNFAALKLFLRGCSHQQKSSVIDGLYWRILKSKSKEVRKLNIVGILHFDVLGIRSGEIKETLYSKAVMKQAVRLIQLISLDSVGKKLAFNDDLLRDFVGLVDACQDSSCFQYVISVLGQISSEKSLKLKLINHDIIRACVGVLRSRDYSANEPVIENIVAIMLNMLEKPEGLRKYQKEKDIFQILKVALRSNFKITRTLIYGIIFALLESEELFKRAHSQKMPEFFSNILVTDPTINRTQLRYLRGKLSRFQPKKREEPEDSQSEVAEEDDYEVEEEDIHELNDWMKPHDEILKLYNLHGKEALAQVKEVRDVLESYTTSRVPKFHSPKEIKIRMQLGSPNSKIQKSSVQESTPYIKEGKNATQMSKSQRFSEKKVNNYMEVSESNKQTAGSNQPRTRPNRLHPEKIDQQKFKADRGRQKETQKSIGNENESKRMRKSVSADRGIGRNIENHKIYESNRPNVNRVAEFKAEEKKYRSPQQNKKSREEILKQINEQIKAEQMQKQRRRNTESQRENSSLYVSERAKKTDEEAFQSRPKLRRTPPHE